MRRSSRPAASETRPISSRAFAASASSRSCIDCLPSNDEGPPRGAALVSAPGPRARRWMRMSGRRDLGDRSKALRVGHGDVGQHLAVQRHLGLGQPSDEAAVAQPREAGRGIDPDDPQRAEVTLLPRPVTAGVVQCALHRLVGALVTILPPAPVPLGQLENPIAAPTRLETLLHPHGWSVRPVGEQLLNHFLGVLLAEEARAPVAPVVGGGLGKGEVVLGERLGVLHLPRLLHLEPLLGGAPGLHLRHCADSSNRHDPAGALDTGGASAAFRSASCAAARCRARSRARCATLGLGARIMNICRPSIRGTCSTTPTSFTSLITSSSRFWPSSLWVISRPRNMMVIRALFPSSRKRFTFRTLNS